MKDYAKIFGRNLARARDARGMTQPELAEKAGGGLSTPYISHVEHGHSNLTIRQCERFAQAVGIPLDLLFDPKGGR